MINDDAQKYLEEELMNKILNGDFKVWKRETGLNMSNAKIGQRRMKPKDTKKFSDNNLNVQLNVPVVHNQKFRLGHYYMNSLNDIYVCCDIENDEYCTLRHLASGSEFDGYPHSEVVYFTEVRKGPIVYGRQTWVPKNVKK